MECPRCNSPLHVQVVKDVNISFETDQCSTCGGTWFGQEELSRVDQVIEPVLIEIRKIPNQEEQMKFLKCPSCNTRIMQKFQHPRDRKVIIDHCPDCQGIWLDHGELEAIQKENWLISLGRVMKWLSGKD